MAKVHIAILILISSLMLIADAQIISKKTEKIAKFRVYVHDVLSGPNATVHEVARANITSTSPTSFGLVVVADDLMTVGPDPNSQRLGRAQGLAINSGLKELSFVVGGVYIFTAGKYNGSTINLLGWKQNTIPDQEVPIVGGTGVFKRAQGHAISNLYSYDPATNTYVFTYDMYVVYHVGN